MNKIVEKIFMLRRHQIIRWGRITGIGTIGLGFLILVLPIGAIFALEWKLKPLAASVQERDDKMFNSIATREDLKKYRTISQERYHDIENSYFDLLSTTAILTSALGLLLLSYGSLCLRARELAVEIAEAKSDD
jgi:hypothetical protein